MANTKKFTEGQKKEVEKAVRKAIEKAGELHEREIKRMNDLYNHQFKSHHAERQAYQERIDTLKDLTRAMAKELSRR